MNVCWILLNAFSTFNKMLLFFIVLMWWILLIVNLTLHSRNKHHLVMMYYFYILKNSMLIFLKYYLCTCLWGKLLFRNILSGNSLVVQWLGLCAFTAVGPGLIPGRGTEIPQATRNGQKEKKKFICLVSR